MYLYKLECLHITMTFAISHMKEYKAKKEKALKKE